VYEPNHGSAPDIAGRGIANPMHDAQCVMLLRHSPELHERGRQSKAVGKSISAGVRPADIAPVAGAVAALRSGDAVVKTDF
jgi:isocitrate/isopropylmalate dehydrogenase